MERQDSNQVSENPETVNRTEVKTVWPIHSQTEEYNLRRNRLPSQSAQQNATRSKRDDCEREEGGAT